MQRAADAAVLTVSNGELQPHAGNSSLTLSHACRYALCRAKRKLLEGQAPVAPEPAAAAAAEPVAEPKKRR